uniref:Uncharacterized protein n=1 Tax=Setaria viridis TaxID=4556 RepID=A0A4U6UG02_SETVI|nr:hypothetical protein SEVIR_5G073266v2 [Setaria viridis]
MLNSTLLTCLSPMSRCLVMVCPWLNTGSISSLCLESMFFSIGSKI